MSYDILFSGTRPILPAMLGEIAEAESTTPLTFQSIDHGTAIAICDATGPVLSLYAPMRVEDESEVDRLFPALSEQLTVPGFLHEAIVTPRAVELGLSLAQRLAKVMSGDVFALAGEDMNEPIDGAPTT